MKTYSLWRWSALLLALVATLSACKKDDPPITPPDDPTANLYQVGEQTQEGYTVRLMSGEAPFVGYNQLYVQVTEEGKEVAITDFTVSLMPMMDMGTMQHTAPTEQPQVANADGLYEGQVVFIMPSGTMGTWTVTVKLEKGTTMIEVPFNVTVKEKTDPRMLTFLGEDTLQQKLFVSLVAPDSFSVGINPFEITIHERASMMSFPPVEDLSIHMTPEMPTMGHGSPNNVNPTHVGDGHYEGEVNFTMTGFWRVHLTLLRGADTVQSGIYFDITF